MFHLIRLVRIEIMQYEKELLVGIVIEPPTKQIRDVLRIDLISVIVSVKTLVHSEIL